MTIFKVYRGEETPEQALEPELPIIDAHHHIWPEGSPVGDYGVGDFRAEVATGHKVVATVFAECMAYDAEGGDEALRPVRETEWVVRSCPRPTSPGRPFIAAGIVGWADLRQPSLAARTLEAHVEAGQGRFSGVRHHAVWHEHEEIIGPRKYPRHLLLDPTFRQGLKEVAARALTYDVWMFSDQLPELAATADAFPGLAIILDHMGGPVTPVAGPEARREVFDRWRVGLAEVARRPNVHLKVGGMGMHWFGFAYEQLPSRPTGEVLAELWRPYFDVALEAFGPQRCMAETNFPPDKHGYSYVANLNALKILSGGYSAAERANLFFGTAQRVYRVKLPSGHPAST
jgi:predicted TIM-barrel fold metal-dependent hydrolase